jgi:hypothetical protein
MYGTLVYVELPDSWSDVASATWRLEASPDAMMRIKRIFPRAEKSRRAEITLSHTPEVCRDLLWALGRWPLGMTDADYDRLCAAAREHKEREDLVHELLAGNRPHLEGLQEPSRPAREYQLVAADLAIATGRLLLADDLGLGKTMSGLLCLRDPGRLPALVVCPTHLPRQWDGEIAKTLPWLKTHIVRTGKPYNPAKRRELRGHDPDVLIINYHKLNGWVDHLTGRVRSVIFDEAQELRRADSDKYKAAARIADGADLRVGLTATPVYNYAGEIHNIMAVLAPEALGSREEFAREWGGSYWTDKLKVRDPRALGQHLRTEGLMLRRTRADVGRELPEVVRVPHSVDADEKVHDRLMEGAVDLAAAILHGEDRKEAFTAAGDLDMKARHATGVAKAPYVAEFCRMLLEAEDRIVLFGWHRDVYDIWLDRLAEFNPVLYTGSESATQKEAAKQRFLEPIEQGREHEACRILMISLRSGAGLDGLQDAAHVAVFGELDWSPAMHDQCIGRLHRDGQGESVIAYFLVSDVGADPVMADVLNVKRAQGEPLRDPDAALFDTAQDTSDRVKRLAEDVLAKRSKKRETARAA